MDNTKKHERNKPRSNVAKMKWYPNKIAVQRFVLFGISGVIAYGILQGYINYYNQVAEYMKSMSHYRESKEGKNEYDIKMLQTDQQLRSKEKAGRDRR